ncbi:hypothetical protein SAMD00019534_005800, partial [Acytostelium subglobosum LB1]|uniref:hypothetical protein n=1 Tax=Acytostelium subglobosum LB1 TaxID=1410327 RepID=UPI000644F4B4
YILRMATSNKNEQATGHVAVVVLGDIGRSPRMQYHALSIAQLPNTKVSIIGYNESIPHPTIVNNDRIKIHSLRAFPAMSEKLRVSILWPVLAALKVMFQIIQLMWQLLFVVPRPLHTVIVQSPPAIPTIFVLRIVCSLRSVRLIIDWHNLGYTLLQLSIRKSETHPIIRLAKWIEKTFGKKAYAHLFVTEAIKNKLVKEWGLQGQTYVLHDKPAPIFMYMTDKERLDFVKLFKDKYKITAEKDVRFIDSALQTAKGSTQTRTALAISSTSWTPDEDFSILLSALVEYDRKLNRIEEGRRPNILFFITGKGPQKEYYEREIAKLNLTHCHVITVWLASEDYPKLLGCADVGVSLHRSSSGCDLPMKVVDMFGCCVPCYAVDFQCLDELVQTGVNGRVFNDSSDLAQFFFDDFADYPSTKLNKFRENLRAKRAENTWDNEWRHIKHLFESKRERGVSTPSSSSSSSSSSSTGDKKTR